MKKVNYMYWSILITYLLLIIGIVSYLLFFKNFISIPLCPILKYSGFYCPACGCTRATISLFHFNILDSIKHNPIVLYFFIGSTLYLIIETISHFSKHTFFEIHKKSISLFWKILIYIGLVILIFNCIITNLASRELLFF